MLSTMGGPSPDVVPDLELPSLSHYEPPHPLAFTGDPDQGGSIHRKQVAIL